MEILRAITEKNREDLKEVLKLINSTTFDDVFYTAHFVANTNQSKDFLIYFELKDKINAGTLLSCGRGFEISELENTRDFVRIFLQHLSSLSDFTGINPDRKFDIIFNNDENYDNKGFEESLIECLNYINGNNGTNESYFKNYKKGTVSIFDLEKEVHVYSEEII